MPRTDRERLEDARNAARQAMEFALGLDAAALAESALTLAAVKYELLVLGEALAGVSEPTRLTATDIPWAQVRGLRNRLAHEYFRVDPQVLHSILTQDLPLLVRQLDELLGT